MTGPQLKALRESWGLTQTGLAEKLGMTRNMIGLYENGKRDLKTGQLKVQPIPLVVELALETLKRRIR